MKSRLTGKKKPQVNIPLGLIKLDTSNPRLPKEYQGESQNNILKILIEEFNLSELAFSMSENGYFDEEPMVVIPDKYPRDFNYDNTRSVDELEEQLQALIDDEKISFIVVEGNRRAATAKVMLNRSYRLLYKISTEDFPLPKNDEIKKDLGIIPCIVYKNRESISPYLGVRHITGILKWEPYSKARYIASRIEEEKKKFPNIEKAIFHVKQQIGDRTDTIRKQYMCFKIVEQAEKDIDYDVSEIINRFSLLTLSINSKPIRDFIGAPSYKEVNFVKPIIPTKKLGNLKLLLNWLYGDGHDKMPIINDSRRISGELAPILASKKATDYLIKTNDLKESYERSDGEIHYLSKKLNEVSRDIEIVISLIWKYPKDHDVLIAIKAINKAVEQLNKMIDEK